MASRAQRLLDRLAQLRAGPDPAPVAAARLVRTARRAGFLTLNNLRHPVDMAREVFRRGVGVRSVHAIHAAAHPERPAIVDDHRAVTYAEANGEIDSLAAGLRTQLRARRGEPVLIMMENRVEYVVAWFALFRLGITCAHISRHAKADELDPLVQRSGGRIVIVSEDTAPVALAVAKRRPELNVVWVGQGAAPEGTHPYFELLERAAEPIPESDDDSPSENVVYTSGTTGKPKGAVRDFTSVGAFELMQILDRLPLRVADRHLVVAPLYHSAGQVFTILNTALAATIHLAESFDAQDTLGRLSRLQIHNVFMVPTMIQRVLDLPQDVHRRNPTPQLRAVISGAAPFRGELRERAIERFGAAAVFDFYGATELGWVTLVDGHEMLSHPGTLGRPIPGQEIAVFDGDGKRCRAGEVGVVYTRSAQLMSGYMDDAHSTEQARREDWLTVDDLGYIDDDGYLFLTGRARDMVISGGINVYPVEIENALCQHPEIADVAVIGIPDDKWGERLVAIVVADERFDGEAVGEWARARMAPYKVPKQWERVDAIPRNPTGKILKRELRARFGEASP